MSTDHVWVFKAERATFPCGVFSTVDFADAWIAKHKLTGVLTAAVLEVADNPANFRDRAVRCCWKPMIPSTSKWCEKTWKSVETLWPPR